MKEKFSRREFIKRAAITGAAAMTPEIAQSADKEKTPERRFEELKTAVADIEQRFERFKDIQDDSLRAGVAKKFIPEMLQRVESAKDEAKAQGAYWILAEQGTERLHNINRLFASLKSMEEEMRSILNGKSTKLP